MYVYAWYNHMYSHVYIYMYCIIDGVDMYN